MIAVRRILVPTDFSTHSASALRCGKALAEAFGATVHVVHVVDEPVIYGWTAEGFLASPPGAREKLLDEVGERLARAFPESERPPGATAEVRVGRPHAELLRYATEQEIDLIVMGTHGRGGVAHLMLGSVTEKLVRSAPCPVLTVRDNARALVAA